MMKSNNSRFVFKPVMVVCLGLVFVGLILYGGYPPPVQASCSWSGDWNTTWGGSSFTLMILAQSGNQASGSSAYNGGTLEGTVSGSTLSGNWLQSNSSGTNSFIMAADCNSFQGSWQGTTGNGGWNGTRVSAIPTPTLRPTNTSVPVTSTPLPTDRIGINFTAKPTRTFTLSGQVTLATKTPLANVQITTQNGQNATTNAAGYYTLTGVVYGKHILTPTLEGYRFNPTDRTVSVTTTDRINVNFTAAQLTYTVTGRVMEQTTPTQGVSGVTIATQGGNVTTNAQGYYTFTALAAGTYSFTATHRNREYSFQPDGDSTRVLSGTPRLIAGPNFVKLSPSDPNQTFTITGRVASVANQPIANVTMVLNYTQSLTTTTDAQGNYAFPNLMPGNYTLTPTLWLYDIDLPLASMTLDKQDIKKDFVATEIIVPNIAKGANFLSWTANTPQDYVDHNIRWNLEQAKDVEHDASYITSFDSHGIKTLIRLELENTPYEGYHGQPLPSAQLNTALDCDSQLGTWMGHLDLVYQRFIEQPNELGEAINIPNETIFILDNEPNHPTDEWGYTGEQYAYVFNCYYTHWQSIRRNGHKLYVAGPAHDANSVVQGWEAFQGELFSRITQTDGWAMHDYGYYPGADANGNIVFKPWLSNILSGIKNHPSSHELIITEYNPGNDNVNKIDTWKNLPEPRRRNNWDEWFKRTYCYAAAGQLNYTNEVNLNGLLYFADAASAERTTCTGGWSYIALCSQADWREAWLGLNNDFNSERTKYPYFPAPKQNYQNWCQDRPNQRLNVSTLNQTPTPEPAGGYYPTTVGGVISGTLSGIEHIVYIYDDLYVPPGQVLTITRDTELYFVLGTKMTVAGKLVTQGGNVFSTKSKTDELWGGIHFLPSSSGSICDYCTFSRVNPGQAALNLEAPITLIEPRFFAITEGIGISSSIPISLSHFFMSHVATPFYFSGSPTMTSRLNHLTIDNCQQGIVNEGQTVQLVNSIVTNCHTAISTTHGTSQISYTLFYSNGQNFVTQPPAKLHQGPGLVYADPLYGEYTTFYARGEPYELLDNSPAANAADPTDDFSQECTEELFSGGRADLGLYGGTRSSTCQIPYEKFDFVMTATALSQIPQPGMALTFTLIVTNTGKLSDSYGIQSFDYQFKTATQSEGISLRNPYDRFWTPNLLPGISHTLTVWMQIPTGTVVLPNLVTFKGHSKRVYQDKMQQITISVNIPHVDETLGRVILEAEEYIRQVPPVTPTLSHPEWLSQTEITGYVGSGYMTASPDVGLEITTPLTSPLTQGGLRGVSPKLSYTINFSQTGTYHVWLRGYAQDKASDSVYVALDDEVATIMTGFTPLTWTWASQTELGNPMTVEVKEAGLHTFNVWVREDGFRLDRMVLTLDGAYHPTGRGPVRAPVPGAGQAYQEDELKLLWVSNLSGVKVSQVYLPVILR